MKGKVFKDERNSSLSVAQTKKMRKAEEKIYIKNQRINRSSSLGWWQVSSKPTREVCMAPPFLTVNSPSQTLVNWELREDITAV